MTRTRLFPLIMFVWLTIGYSAFHLTACTWVGLVVEKLWRSGGTSESLIVQEDGEALIQKWGRDQAVKYRRLDGEIVHPIGLKYATASYIPNLKRKSPGSPTEPYSWAQRIESYSDYQIPATNWYLIAPPNRGGKAYFAGYDSLSRKAVGYLGTNGFSDDLPAATESFLISTEMFRAFHGSAAAVQAHQGWSGPTEPGDVEWYVDQDASHMANATLDQVWVLSDGTLYEIRLRSRSVRTLFVNRPEYQFLTSGVIKSDEKSYFKLLLRSQTDLLLIDPKTEQSKSIAIDQVSREASEIIYQLNNGKLVQVQTFALTGPKEHQSKIIWLDDDGQIERRAEVKLHVQRGEPPIGINPTLALALPVPLISNGAWVISPLIPDETLEDQTYLSRSFSFFGQFSGWIVMTSLTGLLAGWACRWRERDVFGSSDWLWPILVGLCGWFGWMGYICLRPLPARMPNGHWLPSHPEPVRPLGTEIFA